MELQELLKPRYKATITDAYCFFGPGDILQYRTPNDIELKWWEARRISELPEYLIAPGHVIMSTVTLEESGMLRKVVKKTEWILKVKEYLTTGIIDESGNHFDFEIHQLMPSTKEDYENPKEIPKTKDDQWDQDQFNFE